MNIFVTWLLTFVSLIKAADLTLEKPSTQDIRNSSLSLEDRKMKSGWITARFFLGLPACLFGRILEYDPFKVPEFLLSSKAFIKFGAESFVLNTYLAQKYRMPELLEIDFSRHRPEELLLFLAYKAGDNSRRLSPLKLLQLADRRRKLLSRALYGAVVASFLHLAWTDKRLVAARFGIIEFIKTRATFYCELLAFDFSDLKDGEKIIARWFKSDPELFNKIFFGNLELVGDGCLEAFMNAEGTYLGSEIPLEKIWPFIRYCLVAFSSGYQPPVPFTDRAFLEKVMPYIEAHGCNFTPAALCTMRVRFVPGFYLSNAIIEKLDEEQLWEYTFVLCDARKFEALFPVFTKFSEMYGPNFWINPCQTQMSYDCSEAYPKWLAFTLEH